MDDTDISDYLKRPPQVTLRIQLESRDAEKDLDTFFEKLEGLKAKVPGLSFVDVSVVVS